MQPQQPHGSPPQNPEPPREYPPLQPHQPAEYVPGAGQIPQPGQVMPPTQQPIPGPQPLPTYPAGPPTNTKPSDYEFIVNPVKPANKVISLSGGSKFLFAVAGGLLLILLLVGAFALFGNRGDKNTTAYFNVMQQQTELIRITAIAVNQVGASTNSKNSALTTNMTLTTDSAKLSTFLAEGGVKFDPDQLAQGQDAAATKKLEIGVSTNTFDTAYTEILNTKLTAYSRSLQAVYSQASGETSKAVLSEAYSNAQLLEKLAKQN